MSVEALIAIARVALYVAAVLAAGTALFVVLFPTWRSPAGARIGLAATAIAALAFLATFVLGGVSMLGEGLAAVLSAEVWSTAWDTTLGPSTAWGLVGAALLGVGFKTGRPVALGLGAATTIAAFLFTGHAATAPPVWLMRPAVGVHLLAAAFWLGALAPLFRATREADGVAVRGLLDDFSRLAIAGVACLALTGTVMSWIQVGSWAGLLSTTYGNLLSAKLVLFAALLGLAGYNKLILTPRIASAGADLRRSIVIEAVFYVAILALAAGLSLTAPARESATF